MPDVCAFNKIVDIVCLDETWSIQRDGGDLHANRLKWNSTECIISTKSSSVRNANEWYCMFRSVSFIWLAVCTLVRVVWYFMPECVYFLEAKRECIRTMASIFLAWHALAVHRIHTQIVNTHTHMLCNTEV